MLRGRINFTHDYGLVVDGVVFDPATVIMGGSLALTAVGAGASAASTIAGGNFAKQAGQMQQQAANFEADQLEQNATSERGAAALSAYDQRRKADLVASSAQARGAASGVDVGSGSPLSDITEIEKRGTYNAAMDLWRGENAATGDINKAKGLRYSGDLSAMGGDAAQQGAMLTALGTIGGAGGSMLKTYGAYAYPTVRGSAGASV